jgi:alpha-L-rhamnosidase
MNPKKSNPFKKASWITHPSQVSKNSYFYFIKDFHLQAIGRESYKIRIAVDTKYKLFINNCFVCRGPVTTAGESLRYDEKEIKEFLIEGKNSISILHYFEGISTFSHVSKADGIIFELYKDHGNNSEIVLATDSSWDVSKSNVWSDKSTKASFQMGFTEIQDRRKSGSTWKKVKSVNPPCDVWQSRDIPFLTEDIVPCQEIIAYGSITSCSSRATMDEDIDIARQMSNEKIRFVSGKLCAGVNKKMLLGDLLLEPGKAGAHVIIVDFKREIVGFPCIELECGEDTVIDIGSGEKIENKSILIYNQDGDRIVASHANRFTVGKGTHVLEPAFCRSGFRYLQIHVHNVDAVVHLKNIAARENRYPVKEVGSFSCNDPTLNRIWDLCSTTLKSCMLEFYVDCPWREQAQWLGDLRVQGLVNYYAFGDICLIKKGLRELAASQRKDGLLLCLYPGSYERVIPYYSLVWIQSLYDYLYYSDDQELVLELWPTLEKIINGCKAYSSNILLDGFDGLDELAKTTFWNFIEWGSMKNEGMQGALNIFYYDALKKAAFLAEKISKKELAGKYDKLADQVNAEFQKKLWSSEYGCYTDGTKNGKPNCSLSEITNYLALAFLSPAKQKREKILAAMEKHNMGLINSSYYEFFRISYMLSDDNGAVDIMEHIRREWGALLADDFVAVPECLNMNNKSMEKAQNSYCHAWGAHPAYWLSAHILGIRPDAPGWKRILWQPNPGSLKQMQGVVPVPDGVIEVSCYLEQGNWFMQITGPPKANIILDLNHLPLPGKTIHINGQKKRLDQKMQIQLEGNHSNILLGS